MPRRLHLFFDCGEARPNSYQSCYRTSQEQVSTGPSIHVEVLVSDLVSRSCGRNEATFVATSPDWRDVCYCFATLRHFISLQKKGLSPCPVLRTTVPACLLVFEGRAPAHHTNSSSVRTMVLHHNHHQSRHSRHTESPCQSLLAHHDDSHHNVGLWLDYHFTSRHHDRSTSCRNQCFDRC